MGQKIVSVNKKALHDYEFEHRYEAGLVLSGLEIKAVRAGKVNLQGSFARLKRTNKEPEMIVVNLHIGAGENPTRSRKLLLNRKEINYLIGKLEEKRMTLVPTQLYLKRGLAKLEIGLGKGRKLHDKRERLKKKQQRREDARIFRDR
ncbi:SsrA-binding protein SmpB [Candidatus Berkelbacteria bacterium]|nr:SsrA-binding protein SmpB [Candidatus Berkelbacteria bacterium]